MIIPEAARLVLQAAAIGETGQVLVLDMGEPVRFVDLARDLIRLSGHSVDEIVIVFSGLRPGEKLFEELLTGDETTLPTTVSWLRVAQLHDDGGQGRVLTSLMAFGNAAHADDAAVRAWLQQTVPEYGPV